MMPTLSIQAHSLAYGAFVVLIAAAAAFDLWKLIIPNAIVTAVAAIFPVAAILGPFQVDWASHLGAGVTVLVVGAILHRLKQFGAGDAKLLSAIGLWAGFQYLPVVLVYVAIVGGILAFIVVVLRSQIRLLALHFPPITSSAVSRVLSERTKLPYGVAIAIGSVLATWNIGWPGLFY